MEVPNNSSTSSSDIDNDGMASLSQELQQQATTIICRGNLPKEAVEDLKKWLFQHFHYPYPNDAEKEKLMGQTGMILLT
ncbi:Homeobox KN domain protein [compost metagenome]